MNDDWFGGIAKDIKIWLLGALGAVVVSLASYLFLHSFSKPYWSVGGEIEVATNQVHRVLFVTNPGPWNSRNAVVEFQKGIPVQVIAHSVGVTVKEELNKIWCSQDGGLPAGASFFIVFRYGKTNGEPSPGVVCDGKSCKRDPTFDSDLALTTLSIVVVFSVVTSLALAARLFHQTRNHQREQHSQLTQALVALANIQTGGSEISQSEASLDNIVRNKTKVLRKTKPKPVGKPRGGGSQG